ncbi:OCAD1 protein, partial [Atractosteus spatula]|nr:OCAD1 protein [Atractosteus spatula]
MSPVSSAGLTSAQQERGGTPQNPLGVSYIPTEEERRVFRECNEESFWYRSLPFSAGGMVLTQALISRGVLSSSARFGSLPKVAFAGVCGYLAGKMSYMKTCQEKFKNMENSPLGEALRQGRSPGAYRSRPQKSELGDPESPVFDPVLHAPQSEQSPADSLGYPGDQEPFPSAYQPAPFSSVMSESAPSGAEDLGPQALMPYLDDEKPKRKTIMYEELRNKNRGSYEVAMTQKSESPLKPASERASKPEVKTNKYGDAWEE